MMRSSDNCADLLTALAKARTEIGPVEKSAQNPFFNSSYMTLDDIMDAVQPVLAKNGLSVSQWPDQSVNGEPALTTLLFHEPSGQCVQATATLVLGKKDPQAEGSAITYLRRYAYVSILGIKGVEPDDDGNYASQSDKKVTRTGKVADESNASAEVTRLRKELEVAAKAAGLTSAALAKGYHDRYGADYKRDNDETHLAAALTEMQLRVKSE
ncbi:Erf-like ssDNA annealing protein [Mycobacterium phage Azrael100]|nr:Erf-like ssDNA annealing protein [Mycobacterium phage Azrael100]